MIEAENTESMLVLQVFETRFEVSCKRTGKLPIAANMAVYSIRS